MKIAVAGCTGRMGLTLVRLIQSTPDLQLVAGSEHPGYDSAKAKALLNSAGAMELSITTDPAELAQKTDAVIDFTSPDSSIQLAEQVAKRGLIHIIGTTGFSNAQYQHLQSLAPQARFVQSGNFSLGVALLAQLVEQAARTLNDHYDIEIFEMHHAQKKDAPSGTALLLGEAAARGRGVSLAEKKSLDRDGLRHKGDIGFSVARGGDVVGIHEVMFAGAGELISFKHQGFSREIYANGALHAARWAEKQSPGLYSMRDVVASLNS